MSWNNKETVVKKNGQCYNRGMHKYCSYWKAKHSKINKKTIGFRCSLFDLDKEGYNSLSICNKTYGQTYDKLINE